jgi:hypothetical protein
MGQQVFDDVIVTGNSFGTTRYETSRSRDVLTFRCIRKGNSKVAGSLRRTALAWPHTKLAAESWLVRYGSKMPRATEAWGLSPSHPAVVSG